jgi:hypothetical protein
MSARGVFGRVTAEAAIPRSDKAGGPDNRKSSRRSSDDMSGPSCDQILIGSSTTSAESTVTTSFEEALKGIQNEIFP